MGAEVKSYLSYMFMTCSKWPFFCRKLKLKDLFWVDVSLGADI